MQHKMSGPIPSGKLVGKRAKEEDSWLILDTKKATSMQALDDVATTFSG
jgi:hypothetical protein